MNLYLVSRTDKWGWDEFSCFVCLAHTEQEARYTHPRFDRPVSETLCGVGDKGAWALGQVGDDYYDDGGWVRVEQVPRLEVQLIGVADEAFERQVSCRIVCYSFHAG